MKAVGLILAGGSSNKMRELTRKRAAAAMPIAGSYRAIDFALSNMSNSGISKVAVLTQYNSRSLHEHLNSGKWWDFGRKQGGLSVLSPVVTPESSNWYRGTADAIYQNIDFIKNYLLSLTSFLTFSHFWLAIPQLVLQADWQEVWHSPQPPFFGLNKGFLYLK